MISARHNIISLGCGARLWYPVNEATLSLAGSQTVRWRKPRWVPVAKSKMFKIPPRTITPKEEVVEITRLFNMYRTQMRAVRRHLWEESLRRADTSELSMQQAAEDEAEHQQILEYNHQENLRVAALREERVRKEFEANLARVEASKEKLAKQALEAQEKALHLITETQALVKTFIKREDLEEAIETAIANPIDYNFVIDQEGHIFRGCNTKPESIPEEDREKLLSVAQER
ncbi:probable 28S ribosomal protein S26, mitochondrial [Homarus americanus]|nr:probable 28S ribosomal protein S26, mitochondrial [Homarus americanus]